MEGSGRTTETTAGLRDEVNTGRQGSMISSNAIWMTSARGDNVSQQPLLFFG